MKKELFGNFRFMEKDFEKCDENEDGARYVRERLKELNKVLEPRIKEIDADLESQVSHPFNRGEKKWRKAGWIRYYHPRGRRLKEQWKRGAQLQIYVYKPGLDVGLWFEPEAAEDLEKFKKLVKSDEKGFLEWAKAHDLAFWVEEGKFDKEASKMELRDLSKFLDALVKGFRCRVGREIDKKSAVDEGEEIVNTIIEIMKSVYPFYRRLI